jgi:PEP-CTERM motif
MKTFTKFMCVVAVAIFAAAQARAAVLLSDNFNSYPDGGLAGNDGWTIYSGTGTDPQVISGQVQINQANAPDDDVSFGDGHSNDVLYASFDVNFSALPSAGGTYFAEFKDATSFNLFCRVFATSPDASNVQLGIQNQSTGPAALNPAIFALGTTHTIVVKFDQTGVTMSTLWVDPVAEVGGTVGSQAVGVPNANISAFGLRQSGGEGVLLFDNLLVGNTFADVIPEPSTVMLVGAGLVGLLALRRRRS